MYVVWRVLVLRFRLMLLSLVLPLFMANQCTTAVKHVAKRTVSSPFIALKSMYSAITPDEYQQLIKEENDLKLSPQADVSCIDSSQSKQSSIEDLDNIANSLDSNLCSACVPWASVKAPQPFCSPSCSNACEKVCPQRGLGILDRYKEKVLPHEKDKLSFRNSSSMFKDADSMLIPFQGYCSGMVSSRRKFNMNGFFEPDSEPKDSKGRVIKADDPEIISFYEDIIDRIHDNKPTEIPGYSNLGEFTKDPMIQDIMRQKIADEWADVTVLRSTANSTAIYGPLAGEKKVSPEQSNKVISGLEEKIENVGSGTLYMGLGGTFNMHIVDAFAVIPSTNKYSKNKAKICINDPNYSGVKKNGGGHRLSYKNDKLVDCSPSVLVKNTGEMAYQGYKVTQASVDHDQDEASVTKSVKRLKAYCKSKKSPPCGV